MQTFDLQVIRAASLAEWIAFVNAAVAIAGFTAEIGLFSILEEYVNHIHKSFYLGALIRIILSLGSLSYQLE
jgi:succinate dehydrogenase hydrophobic anchor subunit